MLGSCLLFPRFFTSLLFCCAQDREDAYVEEKDDPLAPVEWMRTVPAGSVPLPDSKLPFRADSDAKSLHGNEWLDVFSPELWDRTTDTAKQRLQRCDLVVRIHT